MVALRQNLLAESAEIEVPATALPFVFYADKARYRAVGGRAPGSEVMRELRTRVAACLGDRVGDVEPAWCHSPASLAQTVARLAANGAATVSVVVLGASESAHLDAARTVLDRALRDGGGPAVRFGPPVWNDRRLPERLAARVLALTEGVSPGEVGVVLVDQGLPPLWERRYASGGNVENYFDQRVRMLLCEAGLAEQHVRIAWLDWQTPDVTEAVRHLAALGCTRVVVAAATIALPTLETALDLRHAISLARVPESVHVMTLAPWGDDEAFVNAVCTSALEPLGQAASGEPKR
jgi:protoheme ferro-lyase